MNLNKEMINHMRLMCEYNKNATEKELEFKYELCHSSELFFAVNKLTGDFYKGKRNQIAFSKINYLTSSITTNLGKEEKDNYEYYKLSSNEFKIEKLNK